MDKKDAASIIAPPFMSLTKLSQQHLTPIKLHNQLCGIVTKFLLRKGWRYQIGWIFGGFLVGVAMDWIYVQIYNASTAPRWGKILIPMFVECCLCLENPLCHSYLALKLKRYRSPSLLIPFKIFFLLNFFFPIWPFFAFDVKSLEMKDHLWWSVPHFKGNLFNSLKYSCFV